MDDEEVPHFSNKDEEAKYWKDLALRLKEKVDDLEKELIDYQESSSQLEKELEKSLEHADRTIRDLRTKCNRLTLDLDMCREKLEQQCHQSSKQNAEFQKEISEYRENEEKLIKYIRDLEQKNDDLERAERVMLESVGDIEARLNCAIERNALLENELDEKEMLKAMVQRLKDEQRDMQQEINRQRRQTMPDNDKIMERVRSPVDSNKLSSENQTTPASPMKSKDVRSHNRTKSFGNALSCLSNNSGGSFNSVVDNSPIMKRSFSLRKRERESKWEETNAIDRREKSGFKRKTFQLKSHHGSQKSEGKENVRPKLRNAQSLMTEFDFDQAEKKWKNRFLKNGKSMKLEKRLEIDSRSVSSSDRDLSCDSSKKSAPSPFSFLRIRSKKKKSREI